MWLGRNKISPERIHHGHSDSETGKSGGFPSDLPGTDGFPGTSFFPARWAGLLWPAPDTAADAPSQVSLCARTAFPTEACPILTLTLEASTQLPSHFCCSAGLDV